MSDLEQEIAAMAERLRRPCAGIELGGSPVSTVTSCIGGNAYVAPGEEWPTVAEGPMAFVAQVNFAEVPPVPGFPGRGLLQWFVDPTDCYGLTFDETAGAVGFLVRWHPEPDASAPVVEGPEGDLEFNPVYVEEPTALVFRPGFSLPLWAELPQEVKADPVWPRFAAHHGESAEDAEFTYDEHVAGPGSTVTGLVAGSKVGGFPAFTQWDPRGSDTYPAADHPAGQLLLELDSAQTDGWGDAGIGHLFGDPAALSTGDLSMVRYHWDCG